MGIIGETIEMFRYSRNGQIETTVTACISTTHDLDNSDRQMMETQLDRDERTDPLGSAAIELGQAIEAKGNQQKRHGRDRVYERRTSEPF